jgi:predicted nuclease with RNAse H fold
LSVVGLDLAGVETRPTGFCLLKGNKAKTCLIYSDQEIIKQTISSKPKVIAIDAPLSLPPGRKSIEERTSNHLRDSDHALLKMGIKLFPITLGPMRKLTVRGIKIKEILESINLNNQKPLRHQSFSVIEAYPGGAQDVLGIPRKQQGIEKLRQGLEKLGLSGLEGNISDHELDAATCAYVALLFLEGKAIVYGDPKTGIVMPKRNE